MIIFKGLCKINLYEVNRYYCYTRTCVNAIRSEFCFFPIFVTLLLPPSNAKYCQCHANANHWEDNLRWTRRFAGEKKRIFEPDICQFSFSHSHCLWMEIKRTTSIDIIFCHVLRHTDLFLILSILWTNDLYLP